MRAVSWLGLTPGNTGTTATTVTETRELPVDTDAFAPGSSPAGSPTTRTGAAVSKGRRETPACAWLGLTGSWSGMAAASASASAGSAARARVRGPVPLPHDAASAIRSASTTRTSTLVAVDSRPLPR